MRRFSPTPHPPPLSVKTLVKNFMILGMLDVILFHERTKYISYVMSSYTTNIIKEFMVMRMHNLLLKTIKIGEDVEI